MIQRWRVTMLAAIAVVALQFSCNDSGTNPDLGQWQPLGLEGKLVSNLVLIGDHLYATAGRDGLYRVRRDIPTTQWEYLGFADSGLFGELDYGVTSLVHNAQTNELLLGISTHRDTMEAGIFHSTDFGVSWTQSDSGIQTPQYLKASQIKSLGLDVRSPQNIFAGLSITIYKSSNGGRTWSLVYGHREAGGLGINAIRFSPSNPSEMWAGGETSRLAPFLLRSSDGGESWGDRIWFPPNIGPYTYDNVVYDIAIHPTNDSILYFGMLGVIVKTTDKGQTFQRILGWDDGIYRHWRLAINPTNPQELLATGFYLYRTTDGGQSWQRITPPDNRNELYALAVDWNQRILYTSASSPGNGIYRLRF